MGVGREYQEADSSEQFYGISVLTPLPVTQLPLEEPAETESLFVATISDWM